MANSLVIFCSQPPLSTPQTQPDLAYLLNMEAPTSETYPLPMPIHPAQHRASQPPSTTSTTVYREPARHTFPSYLLLVQAVQAIRPR